MSDQSGGDLEQAIKPLHDGFEACEDFCRQTDSDLPDDAEVFVRGARRSSFGLFTYGDLRKLLSAVPVGSQRGGDRGAYFPKDLKGPDLLGWIVGYYGSEIPSGVSGKLLELVAEWDASASQTGLLPKGEAADASSSPSDCDPSRMQWQPIATAPKDGTVFLAYAEAGQHDLPELFSLCAWHEDAGFCICELREPTHWRPLPEPPAPGGPT